MAAKKGKAKTAAGHEKVRVYCVCGGEMENVSVFRNGKLRNILRCSVCGSEQRFMETFREKAILK